MTNLNMNNNLQNKIQMKQRLSNVYSIIGNSRMLVAVSKYHSIEDIKLCYDEGQRQFGESHVQELRDKYDLLPKDIEWHFIGHLQTNKVKYIAPYITMIHAVDSLRLIQEIEKHAAKNNRVIDVLLEIHVAKEESKYGFKLDQCRTFLEEGLWRNMQHVRICGIMTMASFTDDTSVVSEEFSTAYSFYKEVKEKYFNESSDFKYRSWGMSDDYSIAIEHGANIVRVGSYIFGDRIY